MQSYQTEAQQFKKGWGKIWWSVLIQGLITAGFGLYSLLNPLDSAETLVRLFGVLLVVNGIIGLLAAFLEKGGDGRSLSGSAITIIFGGIFIALADPISTFVFGAFLYIIAALLLISGLGGLFAAFSRRMWSGVFGGLFSILIAVVLFTYTEGSVGFMMFVFGAILLLVGVGSIALALVLRTMGNAILPTLDDNAIIGEAETVDNTKAIEGEIIE